MKFLIFTLVLVSIAQAGSGLTRTQDVKSYAYEVCRAVAKDHTEAELDDMCVCVTNEVDIISLYEALLVNAKSEAKGTKLIIPILKKAFQQCGV